MKRQVWLLIGFCVVMTIVACAHDDVAPGPMTRYVLEHDGLEREYFVFLPSSYDGKKDHPTAIFLHGYGGTATGTEAEVTQGLNSYAEKFGYVVVYPQGTWFMAGDSPETQWEATSWNHISDGFDRGPAGPICTEDASEYACPPECGSCGKCGWASCNDDVGFLKTLVATLTANFKVDADSVFLSGFSNGAQMANRTACEASELFAAAVLVGARVEPGFECTPAESMPLLQINGGKDNVVPFDGRVSGSGYFYAATTAITDYWVADMTCGVERSEWTSPTIDGIGVQCTVACGETDYPAIDCIWPEGNHRWPGTPGFRGSNGYCVTELQAASMPEQTICIAPDSDAEFWGSQLMFEFFDEHRGS